MKTVKGRVVYDRPRNFFRIKDVVRILTASRFRIYEIPLINAEVMVRKLGEFFDLLIDNPNAVLFDLSGGEQVFQGQAVRDTGISLPETGVAFIIEEK